MDQLGKGFDDVNLLDSVADKMNQNVISKCQSMIINEEEQSRREAAILDNCQEGFTRSSKLTMKGLLHKKKTRRERRKINGRLIRKYGTTEDLLCSSTNKVAVEEEMNQFNDLLKMLIDVYQDYNQLLDDDDEREDDDWFDEIDTQTCSFKRRVYYWLRETVQIIVKKDLQDPASSQ